jgi:pimeloyl-ACP methyl ester carboxylesterase
LKKALKILGVIWIAFGIGLFTYMYYSFSAQGFDQQSLEISREIIFKDQDNVLRFSRPYLNTVEILFLPGALVDPYAYEPLAYKLAEHGYNFNIMKMPWRMADRGYTNIAIATAYASSDKTIVIMGHSKGGKMAAQFVKEFPLNPDALILLGTTHPRDIDLSMVALPVLKISGSNDFVASAENREANASKLPSTTQFEIIDGGNHSQFGYYGEQFGDGDATISHEQQLDETVRLIDAFLKYHFKTNTSSLLIDKKD